MDTDVPHGEKLVCGNCGQDMKRDSVVQWLASLPIPERHEAIKYLDDRSEEVFQLRVAVRKLEAENAELRRALDQAIKIGRLKSDVGCVESCYDDDGGEVAPELAKYIKENEASDA